MSESLVSNRRNVLMAAMAFSSGIMAGCIGDDDDDDDGDTADDPEHGDPVVWNYLAPEFNYYEGYGRTVLEEVEENLGIQTELSTVGWSAFLDRIYGGTLDFEEASHYSYGANPDRIEPQFYLSMLTSDSPLNPGPWENDEYDQLFEEYVVEGDEDRRWELMRDMQEIIAEEAPFIYGSFTELTTPVNTDMWDIQPAPFLGVAIYSKQTTVDMEPLTDETQLVIGATNNEQIFPNHMAALSANYFMWTHTWDTLGAIGYDGEIVPWSLQEVETVDETTIDMTLREEMVFHDGVPVTVDDLQFTLETLRDYEFPDQNPYTNPIDEVVQVDDFTARVHFERPTPSILTAGLLNISLLPEHIWETAVEESDQPIDYVLDDDELIGHGPWVVESWDDNRVEWSVFDDYWRDIAYDEVIYLNFGSIEDLRVGMENREIHRGLTFIDAPVVPEFEAIDGVEVESEVGVGFTAFALDFDHPPNDNKTFRQALYRGIDWERVIAVNVDGRGAPSDRTPIVPTHPERADLPFVDDLFDPEEARDMLENEGFTWDEDGNLYMPADD